MKKDKCIIEMKYVTYYRVSSREQGESGLGLEAQKKAVLDYIKRNGNKIVAEFTEIESGKKNDRPELMKAIELTKRENATLVIAKLDRLSRNLTFISQLMDSKVKFVCADMPDATELTIHIFASLAQWERKRISERTKAALDAKRLREPDWQPGNPQNLTDAARQKAAASISRMARETKEIRQAWHYIKSLREKKKSYQAIADELNKEGYRTRKGKEFHAWQVWNICKRFEYDEIKVVRKTDRK